MGSLGSYTKDFDDVFASIEARTNDKVEESLTESVDTDAAQKAIHKLSFYDNITREAIHDEAIRATQEMTEDTAASELEKYLLKYYGFEEELQEEI